MNKEQKYEHALQKIDALLEDETDLISIMSTVSFVLSDQFPHFNWVGFYRMVDEETLKVGPYQGGLGCLTIDISRGVCGKCVRERSMQLYNDIGKATDHIACDSDTEAEIVFPIITSDNHVKAVLDIDSITRNCFDDTDIISLQKVAGFVSEKYY